MIRIGLAPVIAGVVVLWAAVRILAHAVRAGRTAEEGVPPYIILDNNTSKMKVYLSGSSIKDSGSKITTIIQLKDIDKFRSLIDILLSNRLLVLK